MTEPTEQARLLFMKLLEMPLDQRLNHLDKVCADNEVLRREVQEMLELLEEAGSYLEQPIMSPDTWGESEQEGSTSLEGYTEKPIGDHDQVVPQSTERFRIIRMHARGGLGKVFIARDRQLSRNVALKEMSQRHVSRPDSRARFQREAEITGNLEHPGIVPVYSLGSNQKNRPYYVMRLIQGENLEQFTRRFHSETSTDLRERSIEFRQLIGRFVTVCQTVAYAHKNRVLHRDLKPANIMIGEFGETLLVDWGLAKLFDEAPDEAGPQSNALSELDSSELKTEYGVAMGTPGFMSPEQAQSDQSGVDLLSDIYSLGATLYVVLTGTNPFAGDTIEILKKTRAGEFAHPLSLNATIPPELAAISIKAMSVDKSMRFSTASELADELERWLADEPVHCYMEPLLVRTRRSVRKHPRLFGAAVSTALLLVVVTCAGLVWNQNSVNELNARTDRVNYQIAAVLERGKRRENKLEAKLKDPVSAPSFFSDLKLWATTIEQIKSDHSEADALARGDRELVSSENRNELDKLERALTAREHDWGQARDLDKIQSTALSLTKEGQITATEVSQLYHRFFLDLTGTELVEANSANIVEMIQRSNILFCLASALDNWALYCRSANDEPLAQFVLSVARAADPDPWRDRFRSIDPRKNSAAMTELITQLDVARQPPLTLVVLFSYARKTGKDVFPLVQESLLQYPQDFWLNLEASNAATRPVERLGYLQSSLAVRPENSMGYNNLGYALEQMGKIPQAVAAYRKATGTLPRLPAPYQNLGMLLKDQHKVDEAMECFRMAIEVDPSFAEAHNNLGMGHLKKNELDQASSMFHKALSLDPKLAMAHNNLGVVLAMKGKLREAADQFERALVLDQSISEPYKNLGNFHLSQRNYEGAKKFLEKAMELDRQDPEVPQQLGVIASDESRFADAERLMRKALELNPSSLQPQVGLGVALEKQQKWAEALETYEMAIRERPQLPLLCISVIRCLFELKRYEELIERVDRILEQSPSLAPQYRAHIQKFRDRSRRELDLEDCAINL